MEMVGCFSTRVISKIGDIRKKKLHDNCQVTGDSKPSIRIVGTLKKLGELDLISE